MSGAAGAAGSTGGAGGGQACMTFISCPDQLPCVDGHCVECTVSRGCASGDVCHFGECRRRCTMDSECAADGLVCNEAMKRCASCDTDADCPGEACIAGACQAICDTFPIETSATIDVIFAVDNSNGMTDEVMAFQDGLNNLLTTAQQYRADVRVVVISEPGPPGTAGNNGVCAPAPLGSGSCPDDSNPPTYTRVDQTVGNDDALQQILAHYPSLSGVLRPNAETIIGVVTDGESAMTATDFIQALELLDPTLVGRWQFWPVYCSQTCSITPSRCTTVGTEYGNVVSAMGGSRGDLCWAAFGLTGYFDLMVERVADTCGWSVPAGVPTDARRTRAVLVADGQPTILSPVLDTPWCADVQNGWFYDIWGSPRVWTGCGTTCSAIWDATTVSLELQAACDP